MTIQPQITAERLLVLSEIIKEMVTVHGFKRLQMGDLKQFTICGIPQRGMVFRRTHQKHPLEAFQTVNGYKKCNSFVRLRFQGKVPPGKDR